MLMYFLQDCKEIEKLVHVYGDCIDGLTPSLSSPINSALSSPSTSTVSLDSHSDVYIRQSLSQCHQVRYSTYITILILIIFQILDIIQMFQ